MEGSRRRRTLASSGVVLALALGVILAREILSPVTDAVAETRAPRTAATIRSILDRGPHAGTCERCHTMHAEQSLPETFALVGPDDNSLCASCHTMPWKGGSYPDLFTYARSSHGTDAAMVWPGPGPVARTEPDAPGKCVNCHDPHGWTDTAGDIPNLTYAREEALCLSCHDGSPASSLVSADFAKPYAHPTSLVSGRHAGAGESFPADFGAAPVNRRHAECEDCHNSHVAHRDEEDVAGTTDLSKLNLGVSRVRAEFGAAGFPPAYTFLAGADTVSTPYAESQLCYKCHSSYTNQPPGQTDLALVLNPANPSYHPVEAPGRDVSIRLASFTPGWSASSITRCGDCHGSDFPSSRGVHGSNYRFLLKSPYTASPQPRIMDPDEICFTCHAWDVYANPSSPEAVQSASRFNAPGAPGGHAAHVGERDVPCYGCHTTHGSTSQRHLIVIGRNPGIVSYTETASGGTCTATCHGPESYAVNYAR